MNWVFHPNRDDSFTLSRNLEDSMFTKKTNLTRNLVAVSMLGAVTFASAFSFGCVVRTGPRRTVATVAPGTVVYTAPPPPRRVVVTRPAAPVQGAVWVEGHWQWNGNQHVWVQGHWIQPRAGYVYVQPRWVRRGNGYIYEQGSWRQGNRRTTVVRPNGRVRTTVRTNNGRRTTVVRPNGSTRTTVRTNNGTTTVRTNGNGRRTTVRTNNRRRRRTTVTNGGGTTTVVVPQGQATVRKE